VAEDAGRRQVAGGEGRQDRRFARREEHPRLAVARDQGRLAVLLLDGVIRLIDHLVGGRADLAERNRIVRHGHVPTPPAHVDGAAVSVEARRRNLHEDGADADRLTRRIVLLEQYGDRRRNLLAVDGH
jgi:hypothetical protein